MRKVSIGLLTALISITTAFANVQTAEELYKARGEKVENALKSYELYSQLAGSSSDKVEAAQNYWLASQSVYFVGYKAKDNSEKKKYHQLGLEVANKGVALLESRTDLNDAQKETLANSLYFYGANLGKWGEANGVASSLGRWPELQETMMKINKLKMNHVQDYGAYRILGRAFYKLPFPLGSNAKALKYLEKAFEETKNGHEISHHGLNVVYYANVLIAEDQKAKAKTILSALVNKDAKTLHADRVPETYDEQWEAKELLKTL